MLLGVAFTVALGVGLMAHIFYSDRSGRDDAAAADLAKRKSE